jgi:class 3 adenylate cyclase
VTDDARTGAGVAAYRGFLFSDMRGFTAFAERHGNAAAAAAVGRFLDIARTAISRHHGAEIKTEGDAIHAVFPSASSAVLCGLDIVDAAAELNAQEPDRPLGLGVGVHAGEAVETAEGYIGRAVNIAARLCSAARPGEVLVSSTVKGITQASIQVGFIPRGKRRLKGIEDPIVVYSVTRDMTASASADMARWARLGAAAIAAVAVVAIAAIAGSMLLGNPAASKAPSAAPSVPAAPSADPVAIGRLAIGTYATQEFEPPFTFRVGDQGWSANRDLPDTFGLVRDVAPLGSIYILRVRQVLSDACLQGVDPSELPVSGPGAKSLLTQLEAIGYLDVSERQPVQVGGLEGLQVDVTVDQGAQIACGGFASEVPVFYAGQEIWGASTEERFRVISVAVDGEPLAIVMSTDWTQTRSVREFEALVTMGENVVETIRF